MAKLIKRQGAFGRGDRYVALTLSGLEKYLEAELNLFGAEELTTSAGAVGFRAGPATLYAALLRSRLSVRILRNLASFDADTREELYQKVTRLSWEEILAPGKTFAIRPQTFSSQFKNARFASQVVKDAIVDRQRKRLGKRSSVDADRPDLQLQLRITDRSVELSLDVTSDPLSKRGYRKVGGTAPINEVLAAGLLDIAGWSGDRPLLDPFCGSGTILAEAVIKALNVPPAISRRAWCHTSWPDFDSRLWEQTRRAARANALPRRRGGDPVTGKKAGDVRLFGMDSDSAQIEAARSNLQRLGAEELVSLAVGDALEANPIGEGVTVVSNLPYGERIDLEQEELESLYRGFGDRLKKSVSGGDAWLLTGNKKASKAFGLRSSSRTILYNGPIECRLIHFELY